MKGDFQANKRVAIEREEMIYKGEVAGGLMILMGVALSGPLIDGSDVEQKRIQDARYRPSGTLTPPAICPTAATGWSCHRLVDCSVNGLTEF